jgi:hypothetical protein
MSTVIGLFASERREVAAYAAALVGNCCSEAEAAAEYDAVAHDGAVFRWWRCHRNADWSGFNPYKPQSHPGLPAYPRWWS